MSQIIEVDDVPVRTACDQWTQFETFPLFMEGVEQVVQVDDSTRVWRARIAGVTREWEAKITGRASGRGRPSTCVCKVPTGVR